MPRSHHAYLDDLVARYEQREFIDADPISVPHGFDDPRDQEVIGLITALLAWGQRRTILNKMGELCQRMRFRPYEFVLQFNPERDRERLKGFKHRTFQEEDAFWLIRNLNRLLRQHDTIEELFVRHLPENADNTAPAIQGFSELLVGPGTPARLQKHLARPSTGSACKRLNMYLRWMVRPGPVDLGIWSRISRHQLMLPLDVHCGRQARRLGMLHRPQNDWRACEELTNNCRRLDPGDPSRYDFAFFGLGVNGDGI